MEHEQRTDGFTALEDYFSGYEVYDLARSKIGKVRDLFVDDNDQPEYVSVKTGFLGTKSTLIPWQIVADKDAVKGGPAFEQCVGGSGKPTSPETFIADSSPLAIVMVGWVYLLSSSFSFPEVLVVSPRPTLLSGL
jgi:hypothetical protein